MKTNVLNLIIASALFFLGGGYCANSMNANPIEKQTTHYAYTENASSLTKTEKSAIHKRIKQMKIDKATVNEFNKTFQLWQKDIANNAEISLSSNLYDRKKSTYYPEIIRMGTTVIPLIIDKLLDSENFMAILFYDDLQQNSKLKLSQEDCSRLNIPAGEQNRVNSTIRLWYDSVK